jgi:hypothetical protein
VRAKLSIIAMPVKTMQQTSPTLGLSFVSLGFSLQAVLPSKRKVLMKKLILALSAAAFVLGTLALPASAQNEHRGAASYMP